MSTYMPRPSITAKTQYGGNEEMANSYATGWHFIDDKNKQNGPVTVEAILSYLEMGVLKPDSLIWHCELKDGWSRVKDVPEFELVEEVTVAPQEEVKTEPEISKQRTTEIETDEKKQAKIRTRNKVFNEIIETERSYVNSLKAICDVFLTPLMMVANDEEKRVLTQSEILSLFSNIQTIATLNKKFLVDLEQRKQNWSDTTNIGDLFLQFAPFFKMYSQYVNNHEHASHLLNKISSEEKFIEFTQKCMTNPSVKGQNLGSLLIMPIQRIPRYKLLLNEYLKNTWQTHSDYKDLAKALALVDEVAVHINEEIRNQQNRNEQRQLEALFIKKPQFVNPGRLFVRQGELTKKCRNRDEKYTFFLFNDLLVYASKVVGKYKMHRRIPIDAVFSLGATNEAKLEFEIVNSKKSFIVYTQEKKDYDAWIEDIKECIDDRKSIIKNDKGASARPVWQQDKTEKCCPLCKNKFTLLRRRHHCRKCGSLVCDDCSKQRAVVSKKEEERICDNCARGQPASVATETSRGVGISVAVSGTSTAQVQQQLSTSSPPLITPTSPSSHTHSLQPSSPTAHSHSLHSVSTSSISISTSSTLTPTPTSTPVPTSPSHAHAYHTLAQPISGSASISAITAPIISTSHPHSNSESGHSSLTIHSPNHQTARVLTGSMVNEITGGVHINGTEAAEESKSGGSASSSSDSDSVSGSQSIDTFTIPKAETLTDKGEKYTTYLIKVKGVEDLVGKRFSEFKDFDSSLRKRYPRIMENIPFPPKLYFNNFSKEVIEERRAGFEHYLQALLAHRPMWDDLAKFTGIETKRWKR